jgi:hypothetical protein
VTHSSAGSTHALLPLETISVNHPWKACNTSSHLHFGQACLRVHAPPPEKQFKVLNKTLENKVTGDDNLKHDDA